MSKNIILCLLFGLSLVSCGKEMPRVRATCEPTQWQICDTISLVEDSGALIGRIKDFIVRDSVLLLTDGVSLYLYDHDGRLLSRFGSQGHASSEYIEITRLYATDNHIYAWCGMSLQLLQYSWGGEFESKYPGLSEGICHFCVQGDSIVHFCQTGRSTLMAGMSLASGRVLYQTEDFHLEDYYLLPYEGSGGLTMHGDTCLFVHASEMVVRKISGAQAEPLIAIKDKGFKVAPVRKRPMVANEAIEYISKNSTCRGLYSDESRLYLIAETGEFPLDAGEADYSRRFLHVIELDSACHVEKASCYPYPFGLMKYKVFRQCLYGVMTIGDRIVVLRYQLHET